MVWDETTLNHQRIARMRTLPREGDGGLLFDATGFEKQGRHSVGVARQYTGTAGKRTNCQVTVNCQYAERTRAWPVATRLYLPPAWAEDAARRQQAHVPADGTFQPKAEIALALRDEAPACGVRHACVTGEADDADHPHFLNGLEERGARQVGAVRANCSVTLGRGQESPGRRWEGFPRQAITVMLSYSFLVWLAGREREHRQGSGRPRAAFAPAPGPSPHAAASGPSPGERMAPLCRHPRIDRTGTHRLVLLTKSLTLTK